MQTSNGNSTIGIFATHQEAENAVKALQHSGFKMDRLSIVARDYQTQEGVTGYYNSGDRMKAWGTQGAFWGGMWGILFGSAFFWIPALGPLLVAGPLVATIVGGLEGAAVAGGIGTLSAAFYSLGIPKDSVVAYETAVKAGQFVLIAHGNVREMEEARGVLHNFQPIGSLQSYAGRV